MPNVRIYETNQFVVVHRYTCTSKETEENSTYQRITTMYSFSSKILDIKPTFYSKDQYSLM